MNEIMGVRVEEASHRCAESYRDGDEFVWVCECGQERRINTKTGKHTVKNPSEETHEGFFRLKSLGMCKRTMN